MKPMLFGSQMEAVEVGVEADGDDLILSYDDVVRRLDLRRLPRAMMHMLVDEQYSYDAVVSGLAMGQTLDGRVNVSYVTGSAR